MPVHDWTRVSAGIFHAFHNSWISELQEMPNAGLLPPSYYAIGEQRAGDITPDVLALHAAEEEPADGSWERSGSATGGLVAVVEAPPQVHLEQEALDDLAFSLARQRSIVIRHSSGDRVVALVEIVSPANKHSADPGAICRQGHSRAP